MDIPSYETKIQQQIEQYRHVKNMHELPDIFHYWSNKHLRPKVRAVFEVDTIAGFYAEYFQRAASSHDGPYRFASLGAGYCSLEIEIAILLREKGLTNFTIECFELSPVLLARGETSAREASLNEIIRPISLDLNLWAPEPNSYTGIMANHSLHHMVELEKIFSSTRTALRSDGVFLTIDMIGRNGHMRWPETQKVVEQLWGFLPDRLKYNQQLNVLDLKFVNRDCSTESFEGIRAQDILPLLVSRFHFSHFLGYGGLIDLFVDRGYGHNFDPSDEKDRALIDFINELNDLLLEHGIIKPTIMFGVMTTTPPTKARYHNNLSAGYSVRVP